MASFGTSENGEPLEFTYIPKDVHIPEGFSHEANPDDVDRISVYGTDTNDTYSPDGALNFTSNYVDLGPGFDTADYSETAAPEGLVVTTYPSEVFVQRDQFKENWEDLEQGEILFNYLNTDEIHNVEAIIGTPQSDLFHIQYCPNQIRLIDGGEESTLPNQSGLTGDRITLDDRIGPMDWQFDTPTSGTLSGQGIFTEFRGIETTGIRPGDTVDGELVPGTPPESTDPFARNCDTLLLSELLHGAEQELAMLANPTEMEQLTLDTLRDTNLATRVESMAHAGIESMDVPLDDTQTDGLFQLVTIAQAVEQNVHRFEKSAESNLTTSNFEAELLTDTEDYYGAV